MPTDRSRRMLAGPTIQHLWVVITLSAAFIGPASTPLSLPDLLWTLLRGSWMATHGRLLSDDPFTSAPHTPGPALNVQWLADLGFHVLDGLGGIPAVITGTALIVVLTYGLLLVAAVTCAGRDRVRLACLAVWAAYALGATNLTPRPQTLSYPLFAFFLLAVTRVEWCADRRWLWLLPLVSAVWANVHGSFFLGWLVLGCAGLGRLLATRRLAEVRAYALVLAACVVASLLNPYGLGALSYVVTLGSNPVVRDLVTEWSPTTVAQAEGWLLIGSQVALAGLAWRARTRLTPIEILLLLAFGGLAWSSVRSVVWWGLILAPIVARLLAASVPRRAAAGRDLPLLNLAIMLGAIGIAGLSTPWTKERLPLLPPDKHGWFAAATTPIGVGDYLRTHDPPPTGRMLNHQTWGGYLEWAAWPRHQVFVDGRIELHPTQVWLDYLDMVFPSAGWRSLFAAYDISYVVLSRTEEPDLIADLRADPTWRLDYEDEMAVVLSRSSDVGVAAGSPMPS